jgi:hypothetical protein
MAVIQERREVSDFDEVVLEGSGVITLVQGEQDGLVIETEESLLPKIKSEVVDGRLRLGFKSWLDYLTNLGHATIHYRVSMRQVRGVLISGSGKLEAGRIETDRLRLKVSGAGSLAVADLHTADLETSFSGSGEARLAGSAQKQEIHISGSGDYKAEELDCQDARVSISGSGGVRLRASQRLEVHISGSGEVRYAGQPNITQRIHGSGSIKPL